MIIQPTAEGQFIPPPIEAGDFLSVRLNSVAHGKFFSMQSIKQILRHIEFFVFFLIVKCHDLLLRQHRIKSERKSLDGFFVEIDLVPCAVFMEKTCGRVDPDVA